jgi:hypothetical protein
VGRSGHRSAEQPFAGSPEELEDELLLRRARAEQAVGVEVEVAAAELSKGMLEYWPSDVPITSARRSRSTGEDAGQRSARSSVDNCFSDHAVTNARQLADLLSSADAAVVSSNG